MRKTVLYEYLGTNGTIVSPIHLEDIYYVRKLRLIADRNKILKNIETDALREIVVIPEADLNLWIEIDNVSRGQE
jgi:hypothetical protein